MRTMLMISVLLMSFQAFADAKVQVRKATIKLNPPVTTTTAAFFEMSNPTDSDINLISVEGDFAQTFELHDMGMKEGKMMMRKVPSILIKKHGTTELKSGGFHVMVFDLKQPLDKKKTYKMKLNFSNQESVQVDASVI